MNKVNIEQAAHELEQTYNQHKALVFHPSAPQPEALFVAMAESLARMWGVDALAARLEHARDVADLLCERVDIPDFLGDYSYDLPKLKAEYQDAWAKDWRC